jgi:hypothetical protein
MTTKPPLQKIIQGLLHIENESKQNHESIGSMKHRKRKEKESGRNINSAAHNQTLKNY